VLDGLAAADPCPVAGRHSDLFARRGDTHELADKRGGGATVIGLNEAAGAAAPMSTSSADVLALDEALDALSAIDSRQCRIVELRFFAGLKIEEAAEALGVSTATVEREWALAKAWLYRRLSSHA
jgi:DNA-directed RNA polymerase specialized sigma24 family protein